LYTKSNLHTRCFSFLFSSSSSVSHGGTYGAKAVACDAAVATQRVIKEEKLVENAAVRPHLRPCAVNFLRLTHSTCVLCVSMQARGEQLTKLLLQLKDKYPQISDVRGPGLMIGVEFYDERDNAYPFPGHDSKHTVKYGFTGALTKKCLDHGMLILNTGYLPASLLYCGVCDVCVRGAVVRVRSCAVVRVR
jgi:4-aminobutyrate aminotransferase-like enzyme